MGKKREKDVQEVVDETTEQPTDGVVEDTDTKPEEAETTKGHKKVKTKDIKKNKSQKEWEDSLSSNKKVKALERRRTLKTVMIIIIILVLVITSTVYLMLLFVDHNNVKISATNADEENLSLSLNGESWAPMVTAHGPERMWNVSYNHDYNSDQKGIDRIPSIKECEEAVSEKYPLYGEIPAKDFIYVIFSLKNVIGQGSVRVREQMTLDSNGEGLEEALRVMWVEHYSKSKVPMIGNDGLPVQEDGKTVFVNKMVSNVYAKQSTNPRLSGLTINEDNETLFTEMVAYPVGTGNGNDLPSADNPYYQLDAYEKENIPKEEKEEKGFFPTIPFKSNDKIFDDEIYLEDGEQINICLVVWIEGSDLECLNDKLNGELTIGVNFKVI